MHKYIAISLLGTALLTSQSTQASENISLDQLLANQDPAKMLDDLKKQKPDNFKHLCGEINDPSFYQKAEAATLGPIKRNKLINACQGVSLEVVQKYSKLATQGEKKAEEKKETVTLKPLKTVDLTKKNNVHDEQASLEAARKIILENAAQLGKQDEFEIKLKSAENELKQATEFYDNLGAIIGVLRDDLKGFKFRIFKPADHEKDSPDQYLAALSDAVKKGDKSVLSDVDLDQLSAAEKLLTQANENLAKARSDLERINRELVELNK